MIIRRPAHSWPAVTAEHRAESAKQHRLRWPSMGDVGLLSLTGRHCGAELFAAGRADLLEHRARVGGYCGRIITSG
jgi:hypothetical protein